MSDNETKNFDIKSFNPSTSLSVEASAGTGKTYTIQLMVAKMIAEGTPLEKILLVTYTEKAAGELKDRLRKKIEEVLGSGKINDDVVLDGDWRKKFETALQRIDNAQVFTIHSFCQKVLREHAYDAGLPFETAIVAEDAVEELIDEKIRDEWVKDEEFERLATTSGESAKKEKLVEAMSKYLGGDNKGHEIISLGETDSFGFEETPKVFEDLLQNTEVKKNFQILEENAGLSFTKKGDKTVQNFIAALREWAEGKELYSGTAFKSGKELDSWPAEARGAFEFFKDFKSKLKDLPDRIFLYRQIRSLFKAWQKRKAEHKLQTYNDMISSVHNAVMTEGSPLKERIRAQYKYAIIDEFQDTNQQQWDIFRTLFFNDAGKPVKDHSVFVVGDPKQSIYSFQGADLHVYQKAVEKIQNGKALSRNYRSTKELVDALNKLFGEENNANGAGASEKKPKYFTDYPYVESSGIIVSPEINGKSTKPIWWMGSEGDGAAFMRAAVAKIVEWCSFSGDKANLQIYDKDKKTLRNVTFRDFAILARTHSEMAVIEEVLRDAGVPYVRYKEDKLFRSRECAEWIAIFRAIDSPDFAAENHKALNEALMTDFFARKLREVESTLFDNPVCTERGLVEEWRGFAKKRRYAEMLERIFEDTGVEARLSDIGKLQSLARLRQIGNYAVDYLYGNRCSLEALIRHLEGLSRGDDDSDDENGDLVEKGTEFDAVQLMTIHASKGLQFPVVVAAAGFKEYYKGATGPYLYHNGDQVCMGFGAGAKAVREEEEKEEWRRLFYVCYTRAESLLLLPRYKKENKETPYGLFLGQAIEKIADDCETLPTIEDKDIASLKSGVREILERENQNGNADKEEDFRGTLQGDLGGKRLYQHSYSTLSKKVKKTEDDSGDDSEIESADGARNDRNESSGELGVSPEKIDPREGVLAQIGTGIKDAAERAKAFDMARYPKGARLGNALHKLLEMAQFKEFEKDAGKYPDLVAAQSAALNGDLDARIVEEFERESLAIGKKDNRVKWNPITAGILWNTLNAKLPVIAGSEIVAGEFRLSNLADKCRKAEARFDLPAEVTGQGALSRFCKGFIDLLFVRDVDGKKRYSILDWKTDGLDDYGKETVQKQVDGHYCVQRVLYSYCLIQWLKQFYDGVDEKEIFNDHFGGIYYVFLRGTEVGTSSGIYAQTWKDYDALKTAYENVKKLMRGKLE